MSEIEAAATEPLGAMIRGDELWLSVEDQSNITRWRTLKSLVGELLAKSWAVYEAWEWKWFYQNRVPFPRSQVFIAQGPLHTDRAFRTGAIVWQDNMPDGNPLPLAKLGQFAFMKIGRAMLMSAYRKAMDDRLGSLVFPAELSAGLIQIFPNGGRVVRWPPPLAFGFEHLSQLRAVVSTWRRWPPEAGSAYPEETVFML